MAHRFARVRQLDYRRLLQANDIMAQCDSIASLRQKTFEAVKSVCPHDVSALIHVSVDPKVHTVFGNYLSDPQMNAHFQSHFRGDPYPSYTLQHPAQKYFEEGNDPEYVPLISDTLSDRQYRESPGYREMMKGFQGNYGASAVLHIDPQLNCLGLGVYRSANDFDERDREILMLVRRQLARWYQVIFERDLWKSRHHVLKYTLTNRGWGQIQLSIDFQLQDVDDLADQALNAFFPEWSKRPRLLPRELQSWLRWEQAGPLWISSRPPKAQFEKETSAGQLSIYLAPRVGDEHPLLLVNWKKPSAVSKQLQTAGLSARQAQVLALIAQGKTDKEICLHLGIKLPTCRRHIDRIFQKIDAPTRAAAASWATSWLTQNAGPSK